MFLSEILPAINTQHTLSALDFLTFMCYHNVKVMNKNFQRERSFMMHKITDLIEPDNGCEGFAEGEEPMVTLILDDGRSVKIPDMTAYKRGWDTGAEISDEDIAEFAK